MTMHTILKWGICLLLCNFLTGCPLLINSDSNKKEHISEAVQDFYIETDQEVYLVDEEGVLKITYTYINEGNQSIYPGTCLGGTTGNLEKFVDGAWIPAYSPFCARPLGPPLEIKPGDRHEAKLRLKSSTWDPARNNASWYGGEIEGTYRGFEKVYGEWSMEKYDNGTLQSEVVVSNAFEIRKES